MSEWTSTMSPGKRSVHDMTSVCNKLSGLGCDSVSRATYGFSAVIIKKRIYSIMLIMTNKIVKKYFNLVCNTFLLTFRVTIDRKLTS